MHVFAHVATDILMANAPITTISEPLFWPNTAGRVGCPMTGLNTNNILSNSKYGFRAHMSTVHSALELTESISDCIDSKQHCAGVVIDLKKAFDTFNHKLLVEKLSFYGVRRIANTWLENYRMNRKQYVVVDNRASSRQYVKCGVH